MIPARSPGQTSDIAAVSWSALGTTAHLLVTDGAQLGMARRAVESGLTAIDLAASRFRDDSELHSLNSGGGGWQPISPLFSQALRVAIDAASWTGGLVDPTVGRSLIDLGYDRTFTTVPASGPAITVALRPAPGVHNLELSKDGTRARVGRGVVVDLGATAKGLASDIAATAAQQRVGCGVLVNLGGDIALAGDPPEGGWPVLITDDSATHPSRANDPDVNGQTILLRSGGLASSGIRARRWQRGGSEIHHLIDPRSGSPAHGPWQTVSVAASTCVLANTASTAAMIMGEGAPRWLTERSLAARLVRLSGAVVTTSGWPAPALT